MPNVARAELVVCLANSDDGSGGVAVAVARAGDGVTVLSGESTNPAQPGADVEIDVEPVTVATVKSVEAALVAPLVATAADLLGVASAALHRSVEYARTRRQFGTPIGAFQGIKHALADNYVSVERARSLTYAAAARLGEPRIGPTTGAGWTSAALAKAAAADAASTCARTNVQVHGALGQTWEHDAHLYVRHAWQHAALLGDSRALYHEVGRRFAGRRRMTRDRRRIRRLVDRLPARRLLRAISAVPLGHSVAARLSACGVRGRLAAAHLASRAWRPVAGLTRRHGNPASRPPCGPRRSCPTSPAPASPRPASASSAHPSRSTACSCPLLRGDEWWALGMSEPEAGSDFAGLRTRAERDGDVFRINGHKIWTTQAHLSRWCTLYARTDPDAPKHRGISCLILDLQSPGVRIEPIRMASISDETFCEVFLDDVEVPVGNLLGPCNGGWNVAMSSLQHERQMIWIMNWVEINARPGLDPQGANDPRYLTPNWACCSPTPKRCGPPVTGPGQ